MDLVKVAFPETPAELAMVVSLLEAEGIPYFVHNGAFGSLYPGVRLPLYNDVSVMVPPSAAESAKEVLAVLAEPTPWQAALETSLTDKLRMAAEALYLGWFVPTRRPKKGFVPPPDGQEGPAGRSQ